MNRLLQDVRYAGRVLRKRPGFTATAVLTLALGIGAAVAIFSVVRGVLLEPLPYPQPDRIVQVWQVGDEGQRMMWSEPNFHDVRDQSRSFQALAAYANGLFTVTRPDQPAEEVLGAAVSDGFFGTIGTRPTLGRTPLPDEFDSAAPVAVVSETFWRSSLGADPDALGRTIELDGQPYTVIGVLSGDAGFPVGAELWMPMEPRATSRTAHNWRAVGRLAPGVTRVQAQRDLQAIAQRLRDLHGGDTWMAGAELVPLREQMVGHVRPALLVLLGAAALLLLIAVANVGNLMLARAMTRGRELAVRLALGARRGRLVRQLLAESLVLSMAGGALGVLLAFLAVRGLLALDPGRLPRADQVGLDWVVLAFALALVVATTLAIGLLTGARATRADVRESLAEGGRAQTGGAAGRRVRSGLVAAQVALTLVLLVGAGLLGRSFLEVVTTDPGYRTGGAVVMTMSLPSAEGEPDVPWLLGPRNTRARTMVDELLARVRGLPGVESAGGIDAFPLSAGGSNGTFLVLERPDEATTMEDYARLMRMPSRTGSAEYRVATPGYFSAMRIPLIRGRLFDERDAPDAQHVAVISESLAETRWPGEEAIGKVIQFGNMDGDTRPFTIVGVVGDVRDRSLESGPRAVFYANARQRTTALAGRFNVVLETETPAATVASARRVAQQVSSSMPVQFRTLEEVFSRSLAERRFSLVLLGVFGIVALLLAAMGVYGVIAFLVAQRTREIGVRIALGATRRAVQRLVVRQGLMLVLIGLGVGLAVAWAATRLLRGMLYGVQPVDPITFGGVSLALAAAALLASWLPARRAARVDPMIALRNE